VGDDISDHEFLEYYKKYYETFGNIELTKQDCDTNSYEISKSFFNKQCVNETRNWDSSSDCVEYDEYVYLTLPFKKDVKIDSVSLYFKAQDLAEETSMLIYFFIVDSFDPSDDFRTYDKWQLEFNKEADDRHKIGDYKDLDINDAYKVINLAVNNYSWNSFTVGFLEKGSSENLQPYEFHDGDKIVLMFKNNSGIGYDEGLSKIKISSTNLIVRANDD